MLEFMLGLITFVGAILVAGVIFFYCRPTYYTLAD